MKAIKVWLQNWVAAQLWDWEKAKQTTFDQHLFIKRWKECGCDKCDMNYCNTHCKYEAKCWTG